MDLSKYIKEKTSCEKIIKLEDGKHNDWLKTVSAFANTKGGVLAFGVSSDDVLGGLENCEKDAEIISEMINTRLEPRVDSKLETLTEDGKDFILVYIESGRKTPYYLMDGNFKTAYVRIKSKNVVASRFQLEDLYYKGLEVSFDTINSSTPKRFVTFTDLGGHYYKRTGERFKDKDLYSFGLIDHFDQLTNAGVLVANEYVIEHYKIICTAWKGLDRKIENIQKFGNREYGGGLTYLLDSAENFIKVHTKRTFRRGVKNPEYPEIVVVEALVNALVHRDYRIEDAIRIDIFYDRLEIYSPGGMLNERLVQKQDPNNIPSFRRNLIISDLFGRMNLMERRGSGLRKIIEAYEKLENYTEDMKPQFISTPASFKVVLYNLNYKK